MVGTPGPGLLGTPQAPLDRSCFSAGKPLDMETLNPCIHACKDTGLALGPSSTGYGNEGSAPSHFPTRGAHMGEVEPVPFSLRQLGFNPKPGGVNENPTEVGSPVAEPTMWGYHVPHRTVRCL